MNFNPQPKKAVKANKYEWAKIKKQAFKRDKYVCQLCNRVVFHPCPHHIIPKGRLRLDILENILTLCWDCHRKLTDDLLDVSIDDLIDEHGLRHYLM